VIDLLYEIKNRTDFVFSWKPVEDGKYGHEVQTDDWDGMIGELKEDVRIIILLSGMLYILVNIIIVFIG